MKTLPLFDAQEIAEARREFEWPIRCTECGCIADLQHYDVMGLDDDDLCCNNCWHIGPMEDLADYSPAPPASGRESGGTIDATDQAASWRAGEAAVSITGPGEFTRS